MPAGPRWRDGRCPRHWYRAAYFGRLDPSPECEPVGVPSVTRFDVLVSAGAAHRAEDPEFEAELERWLGEAA